jgi:hypothetical protein
LVQPLEGDFLNGTAPAATAGGFAKEQSALKLVLKPNWPSVRTASNGFS